MSQETITIKRIPFYLFLILLGFLAAYILIALKNKENDSVIRVPTKAGFIPDEVAKKYLANYYADQEQLDPTYRLVTEKGNEILKGFWITKGRLLSIDSAIKKENPKAKIVGYSLYFGKPDETNKRAYNLVIRGTIIKDHGQKDADTTTVMYKAVLGGIDYEDAGPYEDMVEPCPNRCEGNFN